MLNVHSVWPVVLGQTNRPIPSIARSYLKALPVGYVGTFTLIATNTGQDAIFTTEEDGSLPQAFLDSLSRLSFKSVISLVEN